MKSIVLLGSTGSIGINALNVVRAHPDKFRICGLAAGRNITLLRKQMETFRPDAVSVLDESLALALKGLLPPGDTAKIFHGTEGAIRLASMDKADTVISAMSGAAGLAPTFEAIRAGKEIALANKETMVTAGPLIMAEAKKQGIRVLPIDSEHSAVFQCLQGHREKHLKRIILTASGGPFRDRSLEEMRRITPEQALRHPNWDMGQKITIDSATMMNKGLEVIEARWLFDVKIECIGILVHPQSIVHSMVEYVDGAVIAQLGVPNMMIPIAYALSYPDHLENDLPFLALDEIGTLSFEKPDLKRFPCLDLALHAAEAGGTMPAVLNGANEIAVAAFLCGKIGFLDIPRVIETTMAHHHGGPVKDLETVMAADLWARNKAESLLT